MEGDGHPDSMVLPLLVSLTETARLICFPYVPPVHVSRKRDWRSRDAHLNDKGGWRSWCTEQRRRDVASCSIQKNLEGLIKEREKGSESGGVVMFILNVEC